MVGHADNKISGHSPSLLQPPPPLPLLPPRLLRVRLPRLLLPPLPPPTLQALLLRSRLPRVLLLLPRAVVPLVTARWPWVPNEQV